MKPDINRLNNAFEALDFDINRMIANYRKFKEDRAALLEACKDVLLCLTENDIDCECGDGSTTVNVCPEDYCTICGLKAAIQKAEGAE